MATAVGSSSKNLAAQLSVRLRLNNDVWTTATLVTSQFAITPASAIAGPEWLSRSPRSLTAEFPWIGGATVPASVSGQLPRGIALVALHGREKVELPNVFGEGIPSPGATWYSLPYTHSHPDGAPAEGVVGTVITGKDGVYLQLVVTDGPPSGPVIGAPVVVEDRLVGLVVREFSEPGRGSLPRISDWHAVLISELTHLTRNGPVLNALPGDSLPPPTSSTFFERLSARARAVVAYADSMRRSRRQDRVHMEHIVMGLAREGGSPTQEVFEAAGLDVEKLSSLLSEAVNKRVPLTRVSNPRPIQELPPQSPHVQAAFGAAERFADEQTSSTIETRHLFSGVLSVPDCKVTEVLRRRITPEMITRLTVPSTEQTPQTQQAPTQAPRPAPNSPRSEIADFSPDAASGIDRLNITPEVNALCSVLVAKDVELPISVGLFGDWGSGKSFFMDKMCERIEELKKQVREHGGGTAYCANVVQIWFNAWHYMDTNLWASLGAEIFERLNREIQSDDGLAGIHGDPEQVRARLLAAAASSRDVLGEAERARVAAEGELEASEAQLKRLEKAKKETAAQLDPLALAREGYRVAVQQPAVAAQMDAAARRLGLPAAMEATTEFRAQLLELKGVLGYARGISLYFRKNPRARIWLLVSVLVAVAAVFALPALLRAFPLGTVVSRITALVVATSGVLRVILKYVRPAMKLLKDTRTAHTQAIADAQAKAKQEATQQSQQMQQKVTDAQQRVKDAETTLEKIERQLDDLRADRQLGNFIRDREASTDYTQHLGIVARARRDFQQLSDLLGQVSKERGGKKSAAKGPVANIDRIVLYIDDLDRCPEAKVVDVLQAVHLLLALPLFVVVVGVDPRWLVHSLRQHSRVFQDEQVGASQDEKLLWQSTPLNYMEKIFQIPFTLRPMESTGFANMIGNLSTARGPAATPVLSAPPVPGPGATVPPPPPQPGTPPAPAPATPAPAGHVAAAAAGSAASGGTATATVAAAIDLNPEFLRFDSTELLFMEQLHALIPSPRAAKRFLNIYRLLRASGPRHQKTGTPLPNPCAAQLLLAIQTGFPEPAADILRQLIEAPPSGSWWSFADTFKARESPAAGGDGLEAEKWKDLFARLKSIRPKITLEDTCEPFVAWAPDVARYSFQSGRALLAARLVDSGEGSAV